MISLHVYDVPLALQTVFTGRRYRGAAIALGLASLVGLAWATQVATYFPGSGWYWDLSVTRVLLVLILAAEIAILAPMQVYVLRKGRRRPISWAPQRLAAERGVENGDSSWRRMATWTSGGLGVGLGIACLTCCAPLLLPILFTFLGLSGSAILALNATFVQWSGPLALASLLFGGVTLVFVSHDVVAACALPAAPSPTK